MMSGSKRDLPFGLPSRDRDNRAAEPLRAVVHSEAAGEKTVAVGDVDFHARFAARRLDGPCNQPRPGIDVLERVANDRWLPGRTRRSMDPRDLVHRDAEEAERISVAEVLLCREGEAREVPERLEVGRGDARCVELGPVSWIMLIGADERLLQALHLKRLESPGREPLIRIQVEGRSLAHRLLRLSVMAAPEQVNMLNIRWTRPRHRFQNAFRRRGLSTCRT